MMQFVVDVTLDDDHQEGEVDGGWPFGQFVDLLINDMLDPGFVIFLISDLFLPPIFQQMSSVVDGLHLQAVLRFFLSQSFTSN